jgi:putative membrane protein insertion efficiency factor
MFYELLVKLIIKTITLYQILLSPYLGKNCRYYPTCSAYTKEAILKKGIFKGLILSIWRILRCNPFSKGGYDPVK